MPLIDIVILIIKTLEKVKFFLTVKVFCANIFLKESAF
jgi:hypothetical protein